MTDNIIRFEKKRTPQGKRSGASPSAEKTSKEKSSLDEIAGLLGEAERENPPRTRRRLSNGQKIEGDSNTQISEGKTVNQSIRGNGNVQIASADRVTINQGVPKVTTRVSPPLGTIGASAMLKKRIQKLADEILKSRRNRIGSDFDFRVFWKSMARDLGTEKWTDIWLWDECRASEVIAVLEAARDKTIEGRIKKAAKREGYQHTRGHLFRQEREYGQHLGLSDEGLKEEMYLTTGKESHRDLTYDEHYNFVLHLKRRLDRFYGEEND